MPESTKDPAVVAIERRLRETFADVHVYRYNSASVRVRVIDAGFAGLSRPDRENAVLPLLSELPEDYQADITMLVLLAPGERERSLLNLEFEHPSPSTL